MKQLFRPSVRGLMVLALAALVVGVGRPAPALAADAGVIADTQVLLDYGSGGYRYSYDDPSKETPDQAQALLNFAGSDFDDSAWQTGTAAFGSGGDCPLQKNDKTTWPVSNELYVRRQITIPDGVTNLRIMAEIDNDASIYFDGGLLENKVVHEGCPTVDEYRFDYKGPFTPGPHTLAVYVIDRGVMSFFDMRVLADTSTTPSLAWDAGQTPVAAGAKATAAHQAKFTLTLTDANGKGVPNHAVPPVEVISGGLGGDNSVTASVSLASTTTDANGQIKGTFTSGNRTETTTIGVLKKPGDKTSGVVTPPISVAQVWSSLDDTIAWNMPDYFDYDISLPVTFKMAYSRNNQSVPIDSHTLDPVCDNMTGYRWDPSAGGDDDGDGVPDGDYVPDSFDKGSAGFSSPVSQDDSTKRSDLVTFDPSAVSSSDGDYHWNATIKWNPYFVVDTATLGIVEQDAFGSNGDTGE